MGVVVGKGRLIGSGDELRMNQGTSDSTSIHLLERVKRQEPQAWQRLAGLYGPLVYSWCRQSGVAAQDSPDIVQEVFRSVHRSIGSFDATRPDSSFRGWLWTVTRNCVRDYFRREVKRDAAAGGSGGQRRMAELPEREPESDVSQTGCSWLSDYLEPISAEFEPRTWQAFWRTVIDGQKTSDVADELKVSPNAVRIARSRVLRRLRDGLEGLLE